MSPTREAEQAIFNNMLIVLKEHFLHDHPGNNDYADFKTYALMALCSTSAQLITQLRLPIFKNKVQREDEIEVLQQAGGLIDTFIGYFQFEIKRFKEEIQKKLNEHASTKRIQ